MLSDDARAIRRGGPLGWLGSPRFQFGCALLVLILTCVCIRVFLINDHVVGFYHDDAVYLTTARSLAAGRGLHLDGVPGTPAATRYPPLYPALLSVAWHCDRLFPDNLGLLKSINVLLLGCTLGVTWWWLKWATDLFPWERVVVLVLVGTAPGFLSFADVVLSEPLFVLLVVAALATSRRAIGTHGVAQAAALAALSILTRVAGVSVAFAVIIAAWQISRRMAAIAAVVVVGICIPWVIWTHSIPGPPNPLLAYYVGYEESGWRVLLTDWTFALRMVVGNVRLTVPTASVVWGIGSGWLVAPSVILLGIGYVGLLRDRRNIALQAFVATYLFIVFGHPYPFERYLVPLTPFAMAALVIGVRTATRLARPIAWLVVAGVAFLHVGWVAHFAAVVQTGRHGEFGRALPFQPDGFLRTADWVRQNTRHSAVLASGYDQFYALYTNRRAVRPWFHPVTIDDPSDWRPHSGEWLLTNLRELGVTYLITDPLLLGPAGDYERRSIRSVIEAGANHWTAVYRDPDGQHVVYQYRNTSPVARGVAMRSVTPVRHGVAALAAGPDARADAGRPSSPGTRVVRYGVRKPDT